MFVKGTDFLLEGGREHAAPGLLAASRPSRSTRASPGSPTRCARSASPPERAASPLRPARARSSASCSCPDGDGPRPVAVVIHGGFWQAHYGRKLMRALCARPRRARLGGVEPRVPAARARSRRRLAARRSTTSPPRSTTSPTSADARLDLARVVAIGHSAGGTWRRGRRPRAPEALARVRACPSPRAVAQAGVVDLGSPRSCGSRAASCGAARRHARRSCPSATRSPRRPSGSRSACPVLLTHGGRDDIVPPR